MPASSGRTACSSSQTSVLPGTTQTSSAISREAGESWLVLESTASRTETGTVPTAVAKRFGDEERIAAGDAVQPADGTPRLPGKLCDGGLRKRRECHSVRGRARQVADYEPKWMPRANLVVAIRDREHCACTMNSAAQMLEQVKRCFVRPMHVFKNNQRLRPLQLIKRCGEDFLALRCSIDGRQQRALRLPGDIVQRGERPGCEERVARPPQYARLRAAAWRIPAAARSCPCPPRLPRGRHSLLDPSRRRAIAPSRRDIVRARAVPSKVYPKDPWPATCNPSARSRKVPSLTALSGHASSQYGRPFPPIWVTLPI